MKFYGISIYVSDIEKARSFYKDMLGLEENWYFEEMKAAGLKMGDVELIIAQPDDPARIGKELQASVIVDDIHKTHAELKEKGVEFTAEPWKEPWGGTVTFMLDPDGNRLMLFS